MSLRQTHNLGISATQVTAWDSTGLPSSFRTVPSRSLQWLTCSMATLLAKDCRIMSIRKRNIKTHIVERIFVRWVSLDVIGDMRSGGRLE